MPVGGASSCIVHTSTAELGGAEISLIEILKSFPDKPHFLVPVEGPLCEAILKVGFTYQVLAWPRGLSRITQGRWLVLPLLIPLWVPYLFRLYSATSSLRSATGKSATLWSSGIKSHCACLLLSPWFRSILLFDIRDFLRPLFLRKLIAQAGLKFNCRIRANSHAVGRDYPRAEVHYPLVNLVRKPVDLRNQKGKRIVAHLAYFAPYKGQDLFLNCARKILDAGIDAEFWMIGEVIYPAPIYLAYREKLLAQAAHLNLGKNLRFMGKIRSGEPVQNLLEQVHLVLHCTRDPEPYGRVAMEGLLCGCEVIVHGGSGVCETSEVSENFPEWIKPLESFLGPEYVSLRPRLSRPF